MELPSTLRRPKLALHKKLKWLLFYLTFLPLLSQAQIEVSVPFTEGFLGLQGNNPQQASSILTHPTLGIARSFFVQSTASGRFEVQGNDVIGTARLQFTNGTIMDIPGAIVWRETTSGNTLRLLGFVPNSTVNTSFTYGTGSTYTIIGGQANGNTNIGMEKIGSNLTFSDNGSLTGNAATGAQVVASLNEYLDEMNLAKPVGPVTATSQTTASLTPTLTGTVTLQTGESLQVLINNKTYTAADGLVVNNINGTWSLPLPNTDPLTVGNTYDVTAIITDADGYVLSGKGTVTVVAPNAGTISGTQEICLPGTTQFTTDGTSGGTWTSSNTAVATVDASTGLVTGVTAGTATITYTVGSATATRTVTFATAPDAGILTGTQAICVNGTSQISSNGSAGGSWSSSNTTIATVSSSGLVSGLTAGTSTIYYILAGSGGCDADTASINITVTAAPNAGTISGTLTTTVTGTTTLSIAGNSTSGTWSSSNTAVATINSSTGEVTGVSAGTTTITYTVTGTGGCSDATTTTTVSIGIPDSDRDGVTDDIDLCPNTPAGESVDAKGCAESQKDNDGDGVSNAQEVLDGTNLNDPCEFNRDNQILANVTSVWENLDCDGDGNPNNSDPNPALPKVEDEVETVQVDIPYTFNLIANDDFLPGPNLRVIRTGGTAQGAYTLDQTTGIITYTAVLSEAGKTVTITYSVTYVPGLSTMPALGAFMAASTTAGTSGTGIAYIIVPTTGDEDVDGVVNEIDQCSNTPAGESVDANGCAESQKDDDTDGVTNDIDLCENTPAGEAVDANGCAESQKDNDGDGVSNAQEVIDGTNPNDPCEYNPDNQILANVTSAWENLDCDGDGNPNGSDPNPTVPKVIDEVETAQVDIPYTFNLIANDDFLPGPNLRVIRTGGTAQGPYTLNENTGEITYTPIRSEAGKTVTITYSVTYIPSLPTMPALAAFMAASTIGTSGTGIAYIIVPSTGDDDSDGVVNEIDECPNTPAGMTVDAIGCGFCQKDSNNDGTPDCASYDDDGDGINNFFEGLFDQDGDGIPNYLDTDSDNDSIPDSVEKNNDQDGDGIPNYLDLDSDGDGIVDISEKDHDRDDDGIPNFLDLDSDGDGIPDNSETVEDFDGDGIANFLDFDSDNDTILDKVETANDADRDGMPNYLDLDSDGDKIADISEKDHDRDDDGTPNFLDLDSDGDGILDETETVEDFDNDGIANFLDFDSDNDGIRDFVETAADFDGDGALNFLDLDSDNDGILDAIEKNEDFDGDGAPNFLDLDSDNDGILDAIEKNEDFDSDGAPNFLDLDSDNDSILDAIEKNQDFDSDGAPNFLDLDSDNDSILDAIEKNEDFDSDGAPNFLDLDSDNDSILDAIEKNEDFDSDGAPNFLDLDSDNDTIPDSFEAGSNGSNPVDTDNDGNADFLDLDSDSDSIPDSIEAGTNGASPVDTDNDGTPDFRDLDSDNDTHSDSDEAGPNGNNPWDTDSDSVFNFRDIDSDGDGILDIYEDDIEYGNIIDCNGNGIPNIIDPEECNTFVPEAITPNGDGLNDALIIPGIKRFQNNQIRIFNRWGVLVFEQKNYQNQWKGECNQPGVFIESDRLLPDATYYYIIEFNGERKAVLGSVYLNRINNF